MSHDEKYPGLYRGVVVDANDPKGFGRIKMIVPQVSGENVTDWAWPVLGGISQHRPVYGEWQEDSNQTVVSTTTAYPIQFSVDDGHYGIDIVDSSKFTFAYKGIYNIQFSLQLQNTNTSIKEATIWLRKNGTNVEGSAGVVAVPNSHGGTPGYVIAAWNYVLEFAAGDNFELMWHTNSTDVSLHYYPAGTAPAHPSAASAIITIASVGKVAPQPSEGVWAAFEGGDPNFPLWIGTF
jgi:hypothetical protein